MSNYLQKLRECTQQGIEDFAKDPVGYTKRALVDGFRDTKRFVKENPDLVVSLAGGLICGHEMFGEKNQNSRLNYNHIIGPALGLGGSLAPYLRRANDTMYNLCESIRNLNVFLASFLGYNNTLTGSFFGAIAIASDRLKGNKQKNTIVSKPSEPLEEVVQ
jgi:hypothetical protein